MLEPSAAAVERNYGAIAVPAFSWMWHEARRAMDNVSLQGVYWAWKSSPEHVGAFHSAMQVSPKYGEVLIRLAVPRSRVVLSRFALWEIALVCAPISATPEECANRQDPAEVSLACIMQTCDRIFDLHSAFPCALAPTSDLIQASLTEIRPEWLIEVLS